MKRYFFLLLCALSSLCANAQTSTTIHAPLRVRADLGFCHWYADDLRSSVALTHMTAGVGVRPGLEFLEIRLRYDLSQVHAPAGGTAAMFDGDLILALGVIVTLW